MSISRLPRRVYSGVPPRISQRVQEFFFLEFFEEHLWGMPLRLLLSFFCTFHWCFLRKFLQEFFFPKIHLGSPLEITFMVSLRVFLEFMRSFSPAISAAVSPEMLSRVSHEIHLSVPSRNSPEISSRISSVIPLRISSWTSAKNLLKMSSSNIPSRAPPRTAPKFL